MWICKKNVKVSAEPSQKLTLEDTNQAVNNFTLVHGKRRGMCVVCLSECLFYRGTEGQCTECGCFPAAHLDIDRPPEYNKRRLNHEDSYPTKRTRFLLNCSNAEVKEASI